MFWYIIDTVSAGFSIKVNLDKKVNQERQEMKDLREEMEELALVEIREAEVLRVRQAPLVHKEVKEILVNLVILETKDFLESLEGVVQLVTRVTKDRLAIQVPRVNQVGERHFALTVSSNSEVFHAVYDYAESSS